MANKQLDILINIIKRIAGLDETKKGVKDLGEETEKFSKKAKTEWEDFEKRVKSVHKSFKDGISTVVDWGKKTALAVSGAVAGIAGLAIQSANFNKEVARAATMTDKLGLREMRQGAIELSQEVGRSKSEIADGLYQALSAGVPSDNLFSFVSTASKVAVADGSDVATVVDGLTTVLNSFKMKSEDVEKVADALFKTVSMGKTTFGDLASSMATAAPTAAALGVGYEQVLAAVATLTKQGEPTASAMNKIRNIMLGLNTAMGEGWSKSRSLQEALKELGARSGNSALALEQAFGRENVSGVLALIGDNAGAAAADLAAMATAAGTLASNYNEVADETVWDRAFEAGKNFFTQLGESFNTALKEPVTKITEEIKKWNSDTKMWDTLTEKLKGIAKLAETMWDAAKSGKAKDVADVMGTLVMAYLERGGELAGAAIGKAMEAALPEWLKGLNTAFKAISNIAAETLTGTPSQEGLAGYKAPEIRRDADGNEMTSGQAAIQDAYAKANELLETEQNRHAEKVKQSSEAVVGAVYDAQGNMVTEITGASLITKTAIEESGTMTADAMDQFVGVFEDSNGDIISAMNKAGEDATAEAQALKEKLDNASKQHSADMDGSVGVITAATTDMTGKVAAGITGVGTAVQAMATNTQQGLDQVARNMSATYTALNSTLQSIITQLDQTRAIASSAGRNADTALSQIKNMR